MATFLLNIKELWEILQFALIYLFGTLGYGNQHTQHTHTHCALYLNYVMILREAAISIQKRGPSISWHLATKSWPHLDLL